MSIDPKHYSIMRIALLAWQGRCDKDRDLMLSMAEDANFSEEYRAKARANAKASEDFKREAQEALDAIREARGN